LEDGGSYSFPFPCAFVEIGTDEFGQLGSNFQGIDIDVKIHIGNDYYNGAQFDDNLNIFALRDLAVKKLNMFKPTSSGNLVKVTETQDYNHSNVYHYILQYKTHYIDQTAVQADNLTTPPIIWLVQ
jgi:hypothetical protein